MTQTTHGVVDDGVHLPALLAEQEQRVSAALQTLVADARYWSSANFIALAQAGVRTHTADLRSKQRNLSVEGIHPREDFIYQAATATYQCPTGSPRPQRRDEAIETGASVHLIKVRERFAG